ncbi:MAG: hypothetical protein LBB58_05080 [Cellulomonadaceae bacterium]|nr:hypothetical protein [Cellulomonadaceae bacterium]
MQAAWGRLDPVAQEIIALVGWEELTIEQAARVLGVSHVAARNRLRKARAAMRAEFGPETINYPYVPNKTPIKEGLPA